MMLIPVWASSEHWTLLAINTEEKEIRYYDSLQPASTMGMKNAHEILKLLKKMSAWEWLPDEPTINIRNAAYQSNGVDCGAYVVHYMEEEIRYFRGEGMGHEWPQIITMRSRILGIASVLKKHEEKMKQKAAEMEEDKAAAEKKGKEKAEKEDKGDTKDEDIEKGKSDEIGETQQLVRRQRKQMM